MVYLVTGAAGFIASQVAKLLLEDGHEVVAVDNLNDAYDVRLKTHRLGFLEKNPKFTFYKLDLEDIDALGEVFETHKFDGILNLAARAGVRYSMVNPHVYLNTNATGTLNILQLMVKHGVKKHVLASTSSLYAGQPMPYLETASVNTPISPYAASKKAAEVMCYAYKHLHGIDTSICRFFTVYGPAGRPDMSIFRFTRWIDQGEPIIMYGDGEQSRDFTYVEDIARGAIAALKPVGYEIFNLGGGMNPISMNTVINMLEERLGKKAVIDNQDEHIADVRETWADISKAKEILGWEPQISLEDGLDRTVEWFREHHTMACELDLDV